MIGGGWRTLVLRGSGELRLKDGQIAFIGDQEITVPVDQVARIMIVKPSVMISAALLAELSLRHIRVIICDQRSLPACELTGMGLHHNTVGMLMRQIEWRQESRDETWAEIVRLKIRAQSSLLRNQGLEVPSLLSKYEQEVTAGDPTNREAMAARVYFSALYGKGFHRNAGGNINSALNYGYAILMSESARVVALLGYHSELGIHHCNKENRMNLPCDLMEPFRPFVDRAVKARGGQSLDWTYKKELIAVVHSSCRYGARRMDLGMAMESFTLDVLKSLENGGNHIKELDFAE